MDVDWLIYTDTRTAIPVISYLDMLIQMDIPCPVFSLCLVSLATYSPRQPHLQW